MDITLVICTRNRGPQLDRCLAAVAEIEYAGPWELIVVDNGSTDRTAEVIAQFARSTSFPTRYVFEPIAGLARARNTGIAQAGGALVAFTDDDCYPAPDFLTETVRAFENPQIGYVGGRIRLYDPDDHPITILESEEPATFPPRTLLRAGVIQGANMAFRRAALAEIGGYDPLFGSGSAFPAEDIDAIARANLLGWTGAYVPDIVVFHHHGRKAAEAPRLMKSYDLGRGAYHMKLLLMSGRLDWFARTQLDLLRRWRTDPSSAMTEVRGALAYLWMFVSRRAKLRLGSPVGRAIEAGSRRPNS